MQKMKCFSIAAIVLAAIALVLTFNALGKSDESTDNVLTDDTANSNIDAASNEGQEFVSDVETLQEDEEDLADVSAQEPAVETIVKPVSEELTEQPVEEIPESSILKGKIICIDAGHQKKGNNSKERIAPGSSQTKAKVSSGTRGTATKKYEYELNLEVAQKLKEYLLEKEAVVYMVRETHDVDISNAERAQLANDVNADISFRIHADGSNSASTNGYSILIPGTDYVKKDTVKESRMIAEHLDRAFIKGIQNKSRGIRTRNDLTGFNWCEVPSVLIEMGFMTNPEEDRRMSTEAFQDDLIKAIIEGMESYFESQAADDENHDKPFSR